MAASELTIKKLSQSASLIPDDQFQRLTHLALEYVTTRNVSEDIYRKSRLDNSVELSSRDFDLLYVGLVNFFRKCFKLDFSKNDSDQVQQKYIMDLRLSKTKSQLFTNILEQSSRNKITQDIESLIPSPPLVIEVSWRLDVIISSSDPKEEMKPVIIFKFNTTKGIYSCHCNLSVFHKLRVAVATSLKEIYSLNKAVF